MYIGICRIILEYDLTEKFLIIQTQSIRLDTCTQTISTLVFKGQAVRKPGQKILSITFSNYMYVDDEFVQVSDWKIKFDKISEIL